MEAVRIMTNNSARCFKMFSLPLKIKSLSLASNFINSGSFFSVPCFSSFIKMTSKKQKLSTSEKFSRRHVNPLGKKNRKCYRAPKLVSYVKWGQSFCCFFVFVLSF